MKLWAIPLIAALALSACVKKVETRINSSGAHDVATGSYIWIAPEKTESRILKLAQGLVAEQLKAKGLNSSQDGKYYLEVGVASRPASLALSQSGGALAAGNKKRSSRNCRWNEYRISITLSRISDGQAHYRSSAGEFHCKQSFAQILPVLVDAALADYGNPRGAYVVKRKLR